MGGLPIEGGAARKGGTMKPKGICSTDNPNVYIKAAAFSNHVAYGPDGYEQELPGATVRVYSGYEDEHTAPNVLATGRFGSKITEKLIVKIRQEHTPYKRFKMKDKRINGAVYICIGFELMDKVCEFDIPWERKYIGEGGGKAILGRLLQEKYFRELIITWFDKNKPEKDVITYCGKNKPEQPGA